MAFNRSNNTAPVAANTFANGDKKADFFINLDVEDADGKLHKFGAITLYASSPVHGPAIAHMETAPDADELKAIAEGNTTHADVMLSRVFDVMNTLVPNFRSAVPVASKAVFSFGKKAA